MFEIGRNFRNEGVDSTHSPEFTMLEAYEAYGDYNTIAVLTRRLVLDAAENLGISELRAADGREIDLFGEWRSVTVHELVSDAVGAEVTPDTEVPALVALARSHDVALRPEWDAGAIVLELYEKLVEHTLVQSDVRTRLSGIGAAAGPPTSRPILDWPRRGISLSAAWNWRPPTRNWPIRSSSAAGWSIKPWLGPRGMRKRWSWTKIFCWHWNTECRRPVGWVWAWIAC